MISQFFVLSPRGDKIISRDFRSDIVRESEDIFFRRVKLWEDGGDAPPAFNERGINFVYIKKNSLYLCFTTRHNLSSIVLIELLQRLTRLFKDYVGVLSEEAMRKNFVLVYEILDEVVDFGYVQPTSTEGLKYFIFNDPVEVEQHSSGTNLPFASEKKTVASAAARRPVQGTSTKKKKSELFVDILEKANVVFDGKGNVLHSNIVGSIIMKSFLTGSPELNIGLNEDLIIGTPQPGTNVRYGSTCIDQINFADFVQLRDFDRTRELSLLPPDGEFTLLNYRKQGEYHIPFRVYPYVEQSDPYRIELVVTVRCDIAKSNFGSNVLVRIPMPKATASVSVDFGMGSSNTYEYKQHEKCVLWGIKRFNGETEQVIRIKANLGREIKYDPRKQIGPVSVKFEIPRHNVSGLQIRWLRIANQEKNSPDKWVRYICQNGSYVCRLTSNAVNQSQR